MDYWNIVLNLASKSAKCGDVPVGAIIVKDGKIVAKGYNTKEKKHNILGHAEINAILSLAKKNKNWNLEGYDMYVSLKPCSMCQDVIKQARISNVYYLLDKPLSKNEYDKCNFVEVQDEVKDKYKMVLSDFFKNLRRKK